MKDATRRRRSTFTLFQYFYPGFADVPVSVFVAKARSLIVCVGLYYASECVPAWFVNFTID